MTTATFPPVLLKLDPDWSNCMNLWQAPEDARTTAEELNADLGWSCSIEGLYSYELLAVKDGEGLYRCAWLDESVRLKAKDETTFAEVD